MIVLKTFIILPWNSYVRFGIIILEKLYSAEPKAKCFAVSKIFVSFRQLALFFLVEKFVNFAYLPILVDLSIERTFSTACSSDKRLDVVGVGRIHFEMS